MSKLGKSIKRFVIDTNVFVAAVKPFSKPAQQMCRDMKTLSLLTKLITDEQIELIGNSRLVAKYSRLAEEQKVFLFLSFPALLGHNYAIRNRYSSIR
ncbi:MAG: hypothetical protein H3Z54_07220 [archaeon]|nr:hypothetical protein [archaeon]